MASPKAPDAVPRPVHPLSDLAVTDAVVWGLLDAAPDGLVMVDAFGRILLVNSQLEQLFGYDRGELRGLPVEVLLPDGAAVLDGDRVGRRRDGSEFPVDIARSPVSTGDGQWVIATVRDDAPRRAAERQRQTAAVLDEDVRIATDLGDTVIRELFDIGMRLQSVLPRAGAPLRDELTEAVEGLDRTIREIREVIFTLGRGASGA